LLAYATTKGAIQNFRGLARLLAKKGLRVNGLRQDRFGRPYSFHDAGPVSQPNSATAYVILADLLSSYTPRTTVAVTGGKPFI